MWAFRPLFAAAMACFSLFAVYAAIQWHRKAGRRAAPDDLGVLDTLRFQRRHLERQRDARRGNWRWWLPAFAPGAALVMASQIVETPDPWSWQTFLMAAWMTFGTAIGIHFYERSARSLQREIDVLDSLAKG